MLIWRTAPLIAPGLRVTRSPRVDRDPNRGTVDLIDICAPSGQIVTMTVEARRTITPREARADRGSRCRLSLSAGALLQSRSTHLQGIWPRSAFMLLTRSVGRTFRIWPLAAASVSTSCPRVFCPSLAYICMWRRNDRVASTRPSTWGVGSAADVRDEGRTRTVGEVRRGVGEQTDGR